MPDPTAVHTLLDGHDTPARLPTPGALGVGCIDQFEPFQRSANGTGLVSPLALVPTAAHAVFELQDTPRSEREANGEVGGWIDHVDPFQRSASSTASPAKSP